jgi:endo-1,4-beta-xylanase
VRASLIESTPRAVSALLATALPGAVLLADAPAFAQAAAPPAPVIIEAESGELGAELALVDDGTTQAITVLGTQGGPTPTSLARVATYSVTLPAPGVYDVYARVFVGPDGGSDDSLFYGAGFGSKSEADADAWVLVNNLSGAGFSAPGDVVQGAGFAGGLVWKWVRLSAFNGGDAPQTVTAPEAELTQIFQIAGREDGLSIDKLAFVTGGVFQTVAQLDQGLPGSFESPAPPPEQPPPFVAPGPPLASGKPKFLGNAYGPSQVQDFAGYWNQVTPENGGKWGAVEAERDVMSFAGLDEAYAFAREHGFPFKLHTLIWGDQQPPWLESLPPEEQLLELEEWFAALAERYPDLEYIDVVNEALRDPPDHADGSNGNYAAALGGAGTTGYDWVINAFRLARFYFPTSQLLINEYGVEGNLNESQRYLDIVTLLEEQDLVDGIGIQGHAFSTRGPVAALTASLDLLATAGLPLYVSELDIDGPTDAQQLADYQRLFPAFWEHPAVLGITLWGHRPGMWRTQQLAFLTYEDGGRRPALEWLEAYVRNEPPVVLARQRFSIDEATPSGTSLGIVQASDVDGSVLQSWAISGGTGAALFAVDASTGELTLLDGAALDAELEPFYTLELVVRDAYTESAPATLLIRVQRAPSAAPGDAGL